MRNGLKIHRDYRSFTSFLFFTAFFFFQITQATGNISTIQEEVSRNMWRNAGSNLFKQALSSSFCAYGRGPTFRFMGSSFHRFCSSAVTQKDAAGDEKSMTFTEAKRLMKLVNVEALKDNLGKAEKEVISYKDLLDVCESLGVAKSPTEAAAFARVLAEAGVILLFRDKVYLHPDKVVDLVRRAVPLALLPEDDPCKDELKNLLEKKEEIDMLAHKQVRRILWTGLGLAVVQVGLFFRLTFWEFSWDVMEPIAFFTTATGIVVGYAYFLVTSRDPSYQDLLKRLFLSRQRKLIKSQNFNIQRFMELQNKCKLNVDSCASIKRRTGVEVEPDDLLHGH